MAHVRFVQNQAAERLLHACARDQRTRNQILFESELLPSPRSKVEQHVQARKGKVVNHPVREDGQRVRE